MKRLVPLLLLPITLFAQKIESEISDSIHVGNSVYPTYFLNIDNNSASDPAMVFVINTRHFNTMKKQILKTYAAKKQEYTDFYLLGIDADIMDAHSKYIVTAYLNQIDSTRMKINRSTFLRLYTYDPTRKIKLEYQSTFRNLSEVDNLHYLRSPKDICKYMSCTF